MSKQSRLRLKSLVFGGVRILEEVLDGRDLGAEAASRQYGPEVVRAAAINLTDILCMGVFFYI